MFSIFHVGNAAPKQIHFPEQRKHFRFVAGKEFIPDSVGTVVHRNSGKLNEDTGGFQKIFFVVNPQISGSLHDKREKKLLVGNGLGDRIIRGIAQPGQWDRERIFPASFYPDGDETPAWKHPSSDGLLLHETPDFGEGAPAPIFHIRPEKDGVRRGKSPW